MGVNIQIHGREPNYSIQKDDLVILWNDFNIQNHDNVISLPTIVEQKSDVYRKKFLDWVDVISQTTVYKSYTLEQYLLINEGLSYFWVTSIGQRNNIMNDSCINDLIKLFAFEDILKKHNISQVKCDGLSYELNNLIGQYCKNKAIKFKITSSFFRISSVFKKVYPKNFFLVCCYLPFFWGIRLKLTKKRKTLVDSDVIFFDMLVNVNKKSFESNKFDSNYWTALPDLLNRLNLKTIWGHFFYQHAETRNLFQAEALCNKLNTFSPRHCHTIIDSNTSLKIICKSFIQYVKLFIHIKKVESKIDYNNKSITSFDLKPLVSTNFINSCLGTDAIKFFLYYNLIDKYLERLKSVKICFYLQENQPWETILLSLWRKYKLGTIIGVPHSTIRYWDLRYFFSAKTLNRKLHLPFPDLIAVNGPSAYKLLTESGMASSNIIHVEALRYLNNIQKLQQKRSEANNLVYRILICGDFLMQTNLEIIDHFYNTLKEINRKVDIYIKPHPSKPIPKKLIKRINAVEVHGSLSDLISNYDLFITSNISSSSIDIYLAGGCLLQYISAKYFNMSPLREVNGIRYFNNHTQLADYINQGSNYEVKKIDYFYRDMYLEKWTNLISSFFLKTNSSKTQNI